MSNGKTQCFEWCKKSKSGHFDVRNEDHGKPSKKCVWWDQKGVIYYELLKPGETVNTSRYQRQMIDLRGYIHLCSRKKIFHEFKKKKKKNS